MRILVTADWHLHPFRECSRDGGADRLADGFSAARQLLQAAQRHTCPLVLLGDVKHVRDRWPLAVLNGLLALFREFSDVTVYAVPGNHDGQTGTQSGLDALRELRNVHLFDMPTIHPAPWGEGEVLYWPWQPTLAELPAAVAEAKRAKATAVLGHAFLSGAVVGPGALALKAEATLEQFGLRGPDRVFKWGLFGDIHKQQKVGPRKGWPEVWYPGSLCQQNWGERDDPPKGGLLVDVAEGTVGFVRVSAPRFRLVDWTQEVPAGQTASFAAGCWAGDFVRLVVTPRRADGPTLEGLRTTSGARAFQVVVQRESQAEQRAPVHAGLPPEELLSRYVAARPPQDGLDPKAVLAAGRQLLKEG